MNQLASSNPPAAPTLASAATDPAEALYIERGTPAFLRTNLAFLCAGIATFALLYCVQPLMPVFTAEFGVSPAASSLSLSLATASMAVCMLVASAISEAVGRKPVMLVSVFASAAITIACAFMPGWNSFLALRMLQGILLSGLPAVAMAFIAEEVHPRSSGFAMGLYISGSAMGGMLGRVITGLLMEWGGWRLALGGVGMLGLLAAVIFWRCLPPSRHFQARPLALRGLAENFALHLRDGGLRWLFLEGFLLMGSFVTVYNYIGYRLLAPPFTLSHATVGLVFTVYLVGIGSSTFVGGLADRFGRRRLLWIVLLAMLGGLGLMAVDSLPAIMAGIAIVTFCFFGAHSMASSWVGRRARMARAQASSLYLFCYYMGSSIVGAVGGLAWSSGGWPGVTLVVGGCLALALVAGLRLARLQPLPQG
ncbi:MFS transporter [Roseomonas marmotae]|uniref:MFS transporter n=1 Tax=Roseomonas marmotae TaxID=2768161 RepID=A0ABS3KA59_9PROT|nr:MFS transporter [Roseomonas marmotae]MBO1074356.1 MFS transporter [Roseomonas marmotae]QTI78104.1 MFS transporter [Roseomonas marmotae]